jgi:PhnB protein
MQLQPYLYFEGRCEEALEFYRATVGAEVLMKMRFNESPDQSMVTSENADKVMHAAVRIGGTTIMASDGQCSGQTGFGGFALSLSAKNDKEAESRFNALADGGTVTMPMAKTFFASRFGMLTDRFGVRWMVMNPLM